MEPINVNLSCDIQQPVKVRYLDGYFFSKDRAGHRINVDVFDNGVPVSVGGSVSAEVIRSDGETVPVTGAVSGNRAYVILPQAAYAVVGAVQITIKVTEGTTIVTIACFVAYVHESDTEITVDPGTIIPSIQALISQIETAVASIPADYSSLWTSLAPAFSTSTAYAVGQYVTNGGVLYRFTNAHPAGTWNSAHVTAVNLGTEVSNLKSALSDIENETRTSVHFSWEHGGIDNANGNNNNEGSLIRSRDANYYPAQDIYSVMNGSEAPLWLIFYSDTNGTPTFSWSQGVNANTEYVLAPRDTDVYVRFDLRSGLDATALVSGKYHYSKLITDIKDVKKLKNVTDVIVNNRNLFANPQMLTHDSWSYISTDFTIIQSDTPIFGTFKVETGDTQPFIYQTFQPSKLPAGEYHCSFKAKTSAPTSLRLSCIAYPTPANSGGTNTQLATVNLTTNFTYYDLTVTMPDVSGFDHVRVLLMCVGDEKTYYLTELYFSPTSEYNYSSYLAKYFDETKTVVEQSRLYGKSLYIDGDSIAYGAGADSVSYGDLLATKYSMTMNKQAVSGGTMGEVSGHHCIANSVVLNYNNEDFVILDGGFNDLGNSVPIGAFPTSVEQPLTPSPSVDTFIGAMQVAFQHIMNANPTAKIWFLIPHRIYKSYTKPSGTLGLTFADYVNAIREVCNRYGVEILDVYDNVNFNTYLDVYKAYTLNSDTVHPTLEGYQKFYMPYIEKVTN